MYPGMKEKMITYMVQAVRESVGRYDNLLVMAFCRDIITQHKMKPLALAIDSLC